LEQVYVQVIQKETKMKYLVTLLLVFSVVAHAESEKPVDTITYKDGDVYTVGENEQVFLSTQQNLWSYHPYSKSVAFKKQWPTEQVDRPVPTPNPNPVGSREWCEAHVPYENGYTFADQAWERACDTNNDREYNMCDYYQPTGSPTFEEIAWQDMCNGGKPWDGT